ncbi:MAG: PEP/pyruvate-binding domain-containing protein [Actinomycetota bacterium]
MTVQAQGKLTHSRPDLSGASLDEIGGKAAALVRLTDCGIAVPPFFVVSWRALAQHLSLNGIGWNPRLLDSQGWSSLGQRIPQLAIPAAVLEAVLRQYEKLTASGGRPQVAVRSSAVGEDSAIDSFAGRYLSVLGVSGPEALEKALKQCWASYFDAAAAARRARGAHPADHPDLALIVQAQIFAEKAGVVFTRHPVLPDMDSVYMEANFGTGESVVGGMVTPDSALVSRSTGTVEEYVVGDKRRMTLVSAEAEGSATVEIEPDLRKARVLSDERAAEVARLSINIERAFGAPQDVEWAIDDAGVWVLQARPITTL